MVDWLIYTTVLYIKLLHSCSSDSHDIDGKDCYAAATAAAAAEDHCSDDAHAHSMSCVC